MALCEMCGKEGRLRDADVEGVELRLCADCAPYGTIKKKFQPRHSTQTRSQNLPEYRIVANYSLLLKDARESRSLNRTEFAKLLREKESLVAKWETGTLKPRLDVARRISKVLNISLVDKDTKAAYVPDKKKADEFTLGDFIKVRKR